MSHLKAADGWRLDDAFAQRVEAAAESLRAEGFGAPVGMVLGSGLGNVVDRMEVQAVRPFGEIPGFHAPTVAAHKGQLVQGTHDGRSALILQGRLHAYEGLDMADVVFPIATLVALGCRTILMTNAAGGLHPDSRAGDVMVISSLIDFHWADATRGLVLPPANVDTEVALRAATHAGPFDRALAHGLVKVAASCKVFARTGTYVSLWGPNYETPREIGFLRRIGGDAVGMSTGPESAFARRMGVRLAGISLITNVAVESGGEVVTHDEVIEVGAASRESLADVILAALPLLHGS